jgi:hypothetical protein
MLERINKEQVLKDLREKGYYKVTNFLSLEEIEQIKKEIPLNNQANYNRENLNKNAVYPSMKSDSRQSHASMMIEEGQTNELPFVTVKGETIASLMRFHDDVLEIILGEAVPRNNRKMVNWQLYSQEIVGKSKFLRWHRDGNYFGYELNGDKHFIVKEALYNQYIFGFNIENDNTGEVQGTSFYDTTTGETIHPTHEKGSMVIFDNVRLEHFVRELVKPRIFFGIRSFDVKPFHFSSSMDSFPVSFEDKDDLIVLGSIDSPGFGKIISTEEAKALLLNYYANQWPSELNKIEKEGAVF